MINIISLYFANIKSVLVNPDRKIQLLFGIMKLLFVANPAMKIFCKLIPVIYMEYINNNEFIRVEKVFSVYFTTSVFYVIKMQLIVSVF